MTQRDPYFEGPYNPHLHGNPLDYLPQRNEYQQYTAKRICRNYMNGARAPHCCDSSNQLRHPKIEVHPHDQLGPSGCKVVFTHWVPDWHSRFLRSWGFREVDQTTSGPDGSEMMNFGKYAALGNERTMQWVFNNDRAYTSWCLNNTETPGYAMRRFLEFCQAQGLCSLGEENVALATTAKTAAFVWESLRDGVWTSGADKVVDCRGWRTKANPSGWVAAQPQGRVYRAPAGGHQADVSLLSSERDGGSELVESQSESDVVLGGGGTGRKGSMGMKKGMKKAMVMKTGPVGMKNAMKRSVAMKKTPARKKIATLSSSRRSSSSRPAMKKAAPKSRKKSASSMKKSGPPMKSMKKKAVMKSMGSSKRSASRRAR